MATIKRTLKALDVGQYFVHLSNQENKPITNKKLQKLVYYAQAWHLVLTDKKLFNEPIEAWVHGPAIRSLYLNYKAFGFSPIKEKIEDGALNNISEKTKKFLDEVWKLYGGFDARYLEMLTHSEKPWQDARNTLQSHENSENKISDKSMKVFYSEILKEARKKRK